MRRNTKELILNSAIAVIARDGLASINAIVKHAGLSKSVFFHHFPSKQDVLLKLAERDFVNRIERIKACAKTLPATPGRMLKAYVTVWVDDVALTGQEQMNALCALNEPLLRAHLAERHKHLLDMLWDPMIPEMTIRIIVDACIGGWAQNLFVGLSKETITASRKKRAEAMMQIIDASARQVAETAMESSETGDARHG